jgi:hypothetical protein
VGDTDWMNDQLDKYAYVFTNHIPSDIPKNTKIIPSHGALHWYVNKYNTPEKSNRFLKNLNSKIS